jgi:hypothetical protein
MKKINKNKMEFVVGGVKGCGWVGIGYVLAAASGIGSVIIHFTSLGSVAAKCWNDTEVQKSSATFITRD